MRDSGPVAPCAANVRIYRNAFRALYPNFTITAQEDAMTTADIRKEDHDTKGRFVTTIDGHEAELTYSKLSPSRIIADHTGVPEALKGQGVGLKLVEALVDDARANDIKIVPLCPFVKAQLARHPEWSDVFV